MRRSALGFDTMDQLLDIVIRPDRSKWRCKDEDEEVEIGLYSVNEAAEIHSEGQRVIDMLERNQPLFCDG